MTNQASFTTFVSPERWREHWERCDWTQINFSKWLSICLYHEDPWRWGRLGKLKPKQRDQNSLLRGEAKELSCVIRAEEHTALKSFEHLQIKLRKSLRDSWDVRKENKELWMIVFWTKILIRWTLKIVGGKELGNWFSVKGKWGFKSCCA